MSLIGVIGGDPAGCCGNRGEGQPTVPSWRWGVVLRRGGLERVPPELGLRAVDVCQEVGDGGWQAPQRGTGPCCYIYVDLSDRASQCLR